MNTQEFFKNQVTMSIQHAITNINAEPDAYLAIMEQHDNFVRRVLDNVNCCRQVAHREGVEKGDLRVNGGRNRKRWRRGRGRFIAEEREEDKE